MYKALDPILHTPLRLAIISILVGIKEANFIFLKDTTKASAGNLSVQIQRLQEADYIEVKKSFKDNYPHTICAITPKGRKAFELYVAAIKGYIHLN